MDPLFLVQGTSFPCAGIPFSGCMDPPFHVHGSSFPCAGIPCSLCRDPLFLMQGSSFPGAGIPLSLCIDPLFLVHGSSCPCAWILLSLWMDPLVLVQGSSFLYAGNLSSLCREPLFLMQGTSLLARHQTSPSSPSILPNTTALHEEKACHFELGTKLDGKGKANKREILEKHNTDLFFKGFSWLGFFFDWCKSAPVFACIKVAVHIGSCKHSSWRATNAAANFDVLWRL